jgi:hypothetical protein
MTSLDYLASVCTCLTTLFNFMRYVLSSFIWDSRNWFIFYFNFYLLCANLSYVTRFADRIKSLMSLFFAVNVFFVLSPQSIRFFSSGIRSFSFLFLITRLLVSAFRFLFAFVWTVF